MKFVKILQYYSMLFIRALNQDPRRRAGRGRDRLLLLGRLLARALGGHLEPADLRLPLVA